MSSFLNVLGMFPRKSLVFGQFKFTLRYFPRPISKASSCKIMFQKVKARVRWRLSLACLFHGGVGALFSGVGDEGVTFVLSGEGVRHEPHPEEGTALFKQRIKVALGELSGNLAAVDL